MYNKNIGKSKLIIDFLNNELTNGNGLIKGATGIINLHGVAIYSGEREKIKYHWERIYPSYINTHMTSCLPLMGIALGRACHSLTDDNRLDYQWIKDYYPVEKTRLRNLLDMQACNLIRKNGKGVYYLNPNLQSNKDTIPKFVNDLFKDNSTMRAE